MMTSSMKARVAENSKVSCKFDIVYDSTSVAPNFRLYVNGRYWFGALADGVALPGDLKESYRLFASGEEALAFRDANFDKWMQIREQQVILLSV